MKIQPHNKTLGFSLLEVLLAISIIGIVISLIFATVQSTIKLSASIVSLQNNARHLSLTEDYLSQLFIKLPSNSQIFLSPENNGEQILRIVHPGTSFPSAGREHLAKELTLSITSKANDSYQLQLLATNWIEEQASELPEHSYSTNITSEMALLYFTAYDPRQQAWVEEWDPALNKPSMIKCTFREQGDHSDYDQEMIFLISTQKESNTPQAQTPPST